MNLASGASITYTVTANTNPAATDTTLSNTASATVGAGETNTNPGSSGGTTSATDTDTLTPQVSLVVIKQDDMGGNSNTGAVGTATTGTTITYEVVFRNNGPSTAVVPAADDFVDNIDLDSDSFTSLSIGGATGNTLVGTGAPKINIADTLTLPANAEVIYTVTAVIDAAATGTLSNTASLGTTSATDTDTLSGP